MSVGNKGYGGIVGRTVIMGVVGGTASALGGGKFSNGAMSGAFTQMFNAEAKSLSELTKRAETIQSLRKAALSANTKVGNLIKNSTYQYVDRDDIISIIDGNEYGYNHQNGNIDIGSLHWDNNGNLDVDELIDTFFHETQHSSPTNNIHNTTGFDNAVRYNVYQFNHSSSGQKWRLSL